MISIHSKLNLRNSIIFPIQNKEARRDLIIGGLLMFLLFIGWLMNMGHRIMIVHRMQQGLSPWPSWGRPWLLLKHGFITWSGMVYYYLPSIGFFVLARHFDIWMFYFFAGILFLIATVAIPGYMSHYCVSFDITEIYNPVKAFSRVFQGGKAYWKAWAIVSILLLASFLGLLLVGVGFLFTSVWFWQSAGFSFATVFSQKFKLGELSSEEENSHRV